MKMADARPCSGCADVTKRTPMAGHELTPEEGLRLLDELFGSEDPNAPPTRGRRKYVLEHLDGEPVFRLVEVSNKPALPRDELDVAFDEVMADYPDRTRTEMKSSRRNWLNYLPASQIVRLGRPFQRQRFSLL